MLDNRQATTVYGCAMSIDDHQVEKATVAMGMIGDVGGPHLVGTGDLTWRSRQQARDLDPMPLQLLVGWRRGAGEMARSPMTLISRCARFGRC